MHNYSNNINTLLQVRYYSIIHDAKLCTLVPVHTIVYDV